MRRPRSFDEIKPDPDKVGGIAEAPFVRLPDPATIFAQRARRLENLSADNLLGPYLRFLSDVVSAQHAVGATLTAPSRPSLEKHRLQDDPGFAGILDALLAAITPSQPEAQTAKSHLAGLSPTARLALAEGVFDGAYDTDRIGESLYVAAAVQLYLVRQAACLDPKRLQPRPDNTCPCCGAPPIASLVVGWTNANKARYLCCSLCSTLWNYVRIKCVSCASTDGISYYSIEGRSQDVAVETCTACRSYIKHLQQHTDPLLEPFADDVASHSLDLLVRQEGFRGSAINPLLVRG